MLPIFASLFAGAKTKTRLNSIKQVFWLISLMHGSIFLPISNCIYSKRPECHFHSNQTIVAFHVVHTR